MKSLLVFPNLMSTHRHLYFNLSCICALHFHSLTFSKMSHIRSVRVFTKIHFYIFHFLPFDKTLFLNKYMKYKLNARNNSILSTSHQSGRKRMGIRIGTKANNRNKYEKQSNTNDNFSKWRKDKHQIRKKILYVVR